MLLQILFLDLLYPHQLIKYLCRCFFLLICKNLHLQLAFSLSCRYSPAKICIHNLPFLYLADTPLQKFASATCLFSLSQILPFKNSHPQTAFSLSCRYSPVPTHFSIYFTLDFYLIFILISYLNFNFFLIIDCFRYF